MTDNGRAKALPLSQVSVHEFQAPGEQALASLRAEVGNDRNEKSKKRTRALPQKD